MKTIVQKESPVLRSLAERVNVSDIATAKIQTLLQDLKQALDSQKDGVAIAAPQIAVPLRVFVVSGRAIQNTSKDADQSEKIYPDLIFINPEIVKLSRKRDVLEEGCLSVRYLYGKVSRAEKATVKAYDENGKLFTRGATGLLAQIFQHEVDHLNGILFTDKATDIHEILPETQS